ncbi:MAG TPA: cupin domain-containing protein [Candidatus Acidoferrum sp.]|nr:cupin domain-containing protein [Candidatus Acidoferrum sp.]
MKTIERRTFLEAAIFPLITLGQSSAPQGSGRVVRVEHGVDRFSVQRTSAGANKIAYKVSSQDTNGGLFIFEQVSLRKGGPPRHFHHSQEEWFYVMDGEYVFEVGLERMRLRPGDSLLAPRNVPMSGRTSPKPQGRYSSAFNLPAKWRPSFKRRQRSPTSQLMRSCTVPARWKLWARHSR